MGFTPGVRYAQDASGWSSVTPSGTPQYGGNISGPPASGNTMVLYVASATSSISPVGNDTNNGDAAHPLATVTKAASLMRNGQADWCLIRKGDTFAEAVNLANNNVGKSATEPQVFASYDSLGDTTIANPRTGGARPIFKRDSNNFLGFSTGGNIGFYRGGDKLFFAGLTIWDTKRDQSHADYDPTKVNDVTLGINLGTPYTSIVIEDCMAKYAYQGIGFASGAFYEWLFYTASLPNVFVGDRYTNNGATFQVTGVGVDANGYNIVFTQRMQSSGSPTATGTMTLASGNVGSDATFNFIAYPGAPALPMNPGHSTGALLRRSELINNGSISANGGDGSHSGSTLGYHTEECTLVHNGYLYEPQINFVLNGAPSVNPTAGAIYTDGLMGYTVVSITGSSYVTCTKNLTPASSGVLTKWSGTGDATVNYSAITWSGAQFDQTIQFTNTSATANSQSVYYDTAGCFYLKNGNQSSSTALNFTRVVCIGQTGPSVISTDSTGQHQFGTLQKISGTGDASIGFFQVTDTLASQYSFNHNVYNSQFADEYDNSSYMDAIQMLGNIHCQDPGAGEQQRRGVICDNGLHLAGPISETIGLSQMSAFTNNVVTNMDANPVSSGAQGNLMQTRAHYDQMVGGLAYQGIYQNNIFCHANSQHNGNAITLDNPQTGFIDNNIIYDWVGGVGLNTPTGGIVSYGAITVPGTGATATTFTGFIDDGTNNIFSVSGVTAVKGQVYSNNGSDFTVISNTQISFSASTGLGGTQWRFTTTGVPPAAVGQKFTNNGQTFQVVQIFNGGMDTGGTGAPAASGTLSATTLHTNRVLFTAAVPSGATLTNESDHTISYSAVSNPSSGVYNFTVSAATAKAGATFTNNGQTFTVQVSISSGTTLQTTGTGAPSAAPGTLTNTSDASITFSANSRLPGATLTVTAVTGTPIVVNQRLTGSGLLPDTYITANLKDGNGFTSVGGVGAYLLYMDQRNEQPGSEVVVAPGTTITVDAYYCNMTTQSGVGSGATAYITISGGAVASVTFFPPNAFIGWSPGNGYAVNDQLSTNDVPGLSNTFRVLVGNVRQTTITGSNQVFLTGSNTPGDHGFPNPQRDIKLYDSQMLGGPGTIADFISKVSANFKGNWNPQLTADVVNDWVQEGFGVSESPVTTVPTGGIFALSNMTAIFTR